MGTTVQVQLGSTEEQDSLWFSGWKEAQRLQVRRAGGGFASDGNYGTPTQVCLPALAYEPSELEYS